MRKIVSMILVIIILCSFQMKFSNREIIELLKSDNRDSLVMALSQEYGSKDSALVKYIMRNPTDPRITHEAFHKGMSIYQMKMNAMKRITLAIPPKAITYKPDTSIINFYLSISKKKGWLK